jgi:hypothetical protein
MRNLCITDTPDLELCSINKYNGTYLNMYILCSI